MATVYSYLRFSRPEQMKGDSQRRQIGNTAAWAKANGHALDNSLDLRDLGVSAFRGKNAAVGALAEFLEAVEAGRVKPGSILALESFDRLSRQEIDDADQLFRRILKAGVEIKTFEPNDYFTESDLNNPMKRVMALMIMSRAHEESATKAARLKAAWRNKRERVGQRKLTSICPAWLQPMRDDHGAVVGFEPIAERVELVRRIFQMSAGGMGLVTIAKTLNQEGLPTFGRSALWARSSLKTLLNNRAVLGEHQPHEMRDGRRVPVGEPIADYFPRIVDEHKFYAAQQGAENRRTQPGRHGAKVTNLFTGLVRDARDGSTCRIVNKGDGWQLVSSAALSGKPGAVYQSFPYEPFERALLVWGYDLNLGDVLPRKATNLEAEIAKAEGRAADLASRIATLRAKMKLAENFDVLIDFLVELERYRAAAEAKAEQLKREMATTETEALDRTKELIDRLQTADETEVYQLRLKLRAMLRRLVASIVLLPVKVNADRVALVDVELRNGQRRRFTVMPGKIVELPEGIEVLDVRQWTKWPKKFRQDRFTVVTAEVRQMIELDKEGLDRIEIAARLGVAPSHVSRTLLRNGRRKQPRKAADSPRRMTWHPAGRGWTKCHKGQRYFVGLGTLAELYPKLVKERTADGSWEAANAWWTAKLAAMH